MAFKGKMRTSKRSYIRIARKKGMRYEVQGIQSPYERGSFHQVRVLSAETSSASCEVLRKTASVVGEPLPKRELSRSRFHFGEGVPQVGNSFHRERFNLLDLIEGKIFATAKSLLATAKYYLH